LGSPANLADGFNNRGFCVFPRFSALPVRGGEKQKEEEEAHHRVGKFHAGTKMKGL